MGWSATSNFVFEITIGNNHLFLVAYGHSVCFTNDYQIRRMNICFISYFCSFSWWQKVITPVITFPTPFVVHLPHLFSLCVWLIVNNVGLLTPFISLLIIIFNVPVSHVKFLFILARSWYLYDSRLLH